MTEYLYEITIVVPLDNDAYQCTAREASSLAEELEEVIKQIPYLKPPEEGSRYTFKRKAYYDIGRRTMTESDYQEIKEFVVNHPWRGKLSNEDWVDEIVDGFGVSIETAETAYARMQEEGVL